MAQINGEVVKEYLAKGGKVVLGLAQEFYGQSINEAGNRAFADAIEIGIMNTIASLYDADVDDNVIINILNKFWGIGRDDAVNRLLNEKHQATQRELESYLKLQGMSDEEIHSFMMENNVGIKIRHNPELRELRKKPVKLLAAIKKTKY